MTHKFHITSNPGPVVICDDWTRYYLCNDGIVRDVKENCDNFSLSKFYFDNKEQAQEALDKYLGIGKPEYAILWDTHLDTLIAEVNKYLLAGWKCQGGVQVDSATFYQAMVKNV